MWVLKQTMYDAHLEMETFSYVITLTSDLMETINSEGVSEGKHFNLMGISFTVINIKLM